jgi:hypothetical protein
MEKERCSEEISGEGKWGWVHKRRCARTAWKDGFCKIHHPESRAARLKKSDEYYQNKVDTSPLGRAHQKIAELEAEIKRLNTLLEEK